MELYFYPRPPRGGRPQGAEEGSWPLFISIHALREEGDGCTGIVKPMLSISIHALRKEGDHCNFRLSEQMM